MSGGKTMQVPLDPWIVAGAGLVLSALAVLRERGDDASLDRLAALEGRPEERAKVLGVFLRSVIETSKAQVNVAHPRGRELAAFVDRLTTMLVERAPS